MTGSDLSIRIAKRYEKEKNNLFKWTIFKTFTCVKEAKICL